MFSKHVKQRKLLKITKVRPAMTQTECVKHHLDFICQTLFRLNLCFSVKQHYISLLYEQYRLR